MTTDDQRLCQLTALSTNGSIGPWDFGVRHLRLNVLPLHFACFAIGGTSAVIGFFQTAMGLGHADAPV
jgi:hypothetical protein